MAGPERAVITPAARPMRPFPFWALGGIVLTILLDLITKKLPGVEFLFGLLAIVCAIRIIVWAESELHRILLDRSVIIRLVVTGLLIPFGFLFAMLAAGLIGAMLEGDRLPGAIAVAAMWFASAATGSMLVMFVDIFGRLFASRFHVRILLTVLGLVAASTCVAFLIFVAIPKVVEIAMLKSPDEFTFDWDGEKMTGSELDEVLRDAQLPDFVRAFEPAEIVGIGLALLVFLFVVPALISAASKLGELAMERVHPLAVAFERVSRGDLNVRVEEGGSVEFRQLGQQFNNMVDSLDLSQRMERAFGAYVSEPVIQRIREQQGEIELPSRLKEATVFFADVRGFTSMSEKLAPDEVLNVLDRYYGFVIDIVQEHEGYIDKFIGDAVYVVFNGPIDQPDHVERGTRCAIALQEKTLILNASDTFPEIGELNVGIGVATGPVVAGNLGTERHTQFSVIGDTVNLASRLTDHTPAGEVWVSEETAAALSSDLPSSPLEPIKVKGKEAPLVPYRVFGP